MVLSKHPSDSSNPHTMPSSSVEIGKGTGDIYKRKNVKTAWLLAGISALFFFGMMLKVTIFGGPEIKPEACDANCQKYQQQMKQTQP